MRDVIKTGFVGLLAAGVVAAGAAPAAANESGMCRWNDAQLACTYCSFEQSASPSAGQRCKDAEPGYEWTLCAVWHQTQCLVPVHA